uniref:Uncharacterized protein n=1 Tax=Trypanosoma congolense (strain IL3000) TaxID=1068625 RepID=G0UM86_TRYCI|nr:hypothetical protein, unlikely [Trypanosoma congolense IL3000]
MPMSHMVEDLLRTRLVGYTFRLNRAAPLKRHELLSYTFFTTARQTRVLIAHATEQKWGKCSITSIACHQGKFRYADLPTKKKESVHRQIMEKLSTARQEGCIFQAINNEYLPRGTTVR